MDTPWERLAEALPESTQYLQFHGEIKKNKSFLIKKKKEKKTPNLEPWAVAVHSHMSHKRINYQTTITAKRTVKC